MKWKALILLLLLASRVSAAVWVSSISPGWQAPAAVFAPADSTLAPVFEGAAYSPEGLPFMAVSLPSVSSPAEACSITLDSLVFAPCDPAECAYLDTRDVPDSIIIKAYSSTYKRQKSLEIDICPIIKDEGGYRKLLSAALTVRTPAELRSSADEDLSQRYAESSKLASGTWVKIAVEKSGIYKLTYEQIASMGFSDPASVGVYGYGGAIMEEDFGELDSLARPEDDLPLISVYREKGSDGVFSAGDYLLFYAQGSDKIEYDQDSERFVSTDNYYSLKGYYFLGDAGGCREMGMSEALGVEPDTVMEHGLMHYCLLPRETNLLKSGRRWYGSRLSSAVPTRDFATGLGRIDISRPITLRLELMAYSSVSTSAELSLNGTSISTLNFSRITDTQYQVGRLSTKTGEFYCSTAGEPVFSITYSPSASSDYAYVMRLDATATCSLSLSGGSQLIYYPYERNTHPFAYFKVADAPSGSQIWDISDPLNISRCPSELSGGSLSFAAAHVLDKTYLAVNPGYDFPSPETVGQVAAQNLHALEQCDMVIISPAEYSEQAERIAALHREDDGMTVHVVTPEQIYNEFSSGTPDATAIRWFMKMFYDRAASGRTPEPRYLLFVGRSYYDNRGIENAVPSQLSYQSEESLNESSYSYVSDDYFGMLDDDECDVIYNTRMDIGVGRLPVASAAEAEIAADKIIAYSRDESLGDWRTKFIFVGDDNENNLHSQQSDSRAEQMRSINKSFNADKIFLDAFDMEQTTQGSAFPGARDKMLADLKSGALFFCYHGHGSTSALAHELILTRSDVQAMDNAHLAFWMVAACDIGRFDTPNEGSIGMDMFQSRGAAIGVLTSTRVVFSQSNDNLVRCIMNYAVPSEDGVSYRLGDIVSQGKGDRRGDMNKMNYVFFGDPALKLKYPEKRVSITSINDSAPEDAQMKALGIVSLSGRVEDFDGSALSDFNGNVAITIYDKPDSITSGCHKVSQPVEYTDFKTVLYRGSAKAENGLFSAVFMVPKDINYSPGNGRIALYASDEDTGIDAAGYNESFTVGGSDENYEETTEGPQIRLYLNTPEFRSGQTVAPSPVMYAFFYDEYGINSSSAGLGHDIIMTLNGEQTVMNDYYVSSSGDYSSGSLTNHFSRLADGNYTLSLKAWNMQNVSSTASIDFTVSAGQAAVISNFTASAGADALEMSLNYDLPENDVKVIFYVYDLAGLPCLKQTAELNGDGSYSASWNLATESSITNGVYIARAEVITADNVSSSQTLKILINRQ